MASLGWVQGKRNRQERRKLPERNRLPRPGVLQNVRAIGTWLVQIWMDNVRASSKITQLLSIMVYYREKKDSIHGGVGVRNSAELRKEQILDNKFLDLNVGAKMP